MIFDPKTFYQSYQKDYHKIKATYLKGIMENLNDLESSFFGSNVDNDDREAIKRTIKSDLRHTYFHAIETFFEIFFALNPQNQKNRSPDEILFTLTYSKGSETYDRIGEIANNEKSLDFLNEQIKYLDHTITIGHYIFYPCIFSKERFPPELFDQISESIEAVKYGIKIIASDFIRREEYNAYKHGLRLIPGSSKLMLAEAKSMDVKIEWDISDSMSFYIKTQYPDELKVITKLFDFERDYQMTIFCSNMIHCMIFFRRLMYRFKGDKDKFDQIPIFLFGKEPIEECNKTNVEIQDLVYTVTRTENKKGSS
ncbi:MAG TPA: hypothetical protein VK177_20925 [Flavobacteriales bacterium]|nr:hypothetical protein [Flavobacteriales bacterium]